MQTTTLTSITLADARTATAPDGVVLPLHAPACGRGERVTIGARPLDFALRPTQLAIGGLAIDWLVHDVRIIDAPDAQPRVDVEVMDAVTGEIEHVAVTAGDRSQLALGIGGLPGDLFTAETDAQRAFLAFEIVRASDQIAVVVEYVGPAAIADFEAAIRGRVVI